MDIFDLRNEKCAASPAELDQHQGQFLSFCKKKKIIFTSNFGMLSPCYCYWKDFKFWWSAQGDIWDSAIKTRIMRAYLKNNIWQVRDPGASIRWLPECKLPVKSVRSSLLPLNPPSARVTYLIFIETTFNTPFHQDVASFFPSSW